MLMKKVLGVAFFLTACLLVFAKTSGIDYNRQVKNQPAGGNGSIAIEINGMLIGSATTINFAQPQTTSGILMSCQPPVSGVMSCSFNSNTTVVQSRVSDVSNADHYCQDATMTVAGTCSPGSSAAWGSAYSAGEWVDYLPSTTAIGPASLAVANLSAMSIKLSDGTTDPGSLLRAGHPYRLSVIPSPPGSSTLVWAMTQGDSHQ